jgi:hypothetical protein
MKMIDPQDVGLYHLTVCSRGPSRTAIMLPCTTVESLECFYSGRGVGVFLSSEMI